MKEDKRMKKIYSTPVIRLTEIRSHGLMAGSAKGGYDNSSIKKEGPEDMSRRNNWFFDDDE